MKERGTSTMMTAAVLGILILFAVAVISGGRVLAVRAQASNAADAAALAAAPLTFFPGDPAAEATAFARRHGARIVACHCRVDPTLAARTVAVTVEIPVTVPIFGEITVTARAAAEFAPTDLLR